MLVLVDEAGGISINKDPGKLWGEGLKHKDSFYKYTCGLVFENAKSFINNATVIIDGSGSKDFRKQLERYLKRRINDPEQKFIHKVKVQDSSKNNFFNSQIWLLALFTEALVQKRCRCL